MGKEEKTDMDKERKTGMGKEAKIGLTVIGVLLVIFGLVLANRLRQGDDDSTASNSTEASKDEDAAKNDKTPAAEQTLAKNNSSSMPAVKTTVVPAKTVSKQTPETPASRWNVASDKNKSKTAAGASRAPSYMPNPNTARHYGSYRNGANPSAPKPREQSGQANVPKSNPFRDRQVPDAPPIRQSAQQTGGRSRGCAITGGYSPGSGKAYQTQQPYAQDQVNQYTASNTRTASLYAPASTPTRQTGQTLQNGNGTYQVRPNDSYWEISRKLYGTGAYFSALAEHNRDKIPRENELSVGDIISAPNVTELEKTYPDLCPKPSRRETVKRREAGAAGYRPVNYAGGRQYVVQEGDTLFDIARYELGKASRWVEIHKLNRDVLGDDFDYLTPGLRLALPSDQKPNTVTRRPGPTPGSYYHR